MKILVCISKTPDTTAKISFDESKTRFLEEGVQFIINPYDEWYALVRALELKEHLGGTVELVHVGPAASDIIIRKGLAIGADAAYRIDFHPDAARPTAKAIADFAASRAYDLILIGKETIDHNGSEVGAMLAEYLDWPFISYCNSLEFDGKEIQARREIEGGSEWIVCPAPAVISAAKGLAEQRIPNMKGIMEAKKKPLEAISCAKEASNLQLVRYELPEAKAGVKWIQADDIDALVKVFKEDLKLI